MQEGPLQLLGPVEVPDFARLGPADAALIAARYSEIWGDTGRYRDAALIAASLLSFLPNPNPNPSPSPSPNPSPNPNQASLLSFLPPQSAARKQLNTTVAAPTPTPTPTRTQTLPLPLTLTLTRWPPPSGT